MAFGYEHVEVTATLIKGDGTDGDTITVSWSEWNGFKRGPRREIGGGMYRPLCEGEKGM